MGNIDQWKKRADADFDEVWRGQISELNIKLIFPYPLRPLDKLIFMLGVRAGQRMQRGEWTVPECYRRPPPLLTLTVVVSVSAPCWLNQATCSWTRS